MKRAIATACFWAGLIGFMLALAWYFAVMFYRRPIWPLPGGIVEIEALFVLWGSVMLATFYRTPRPIWAPVMTVTLERVQKSRFLLASGVFNVLIWLLVILVLSVAQVRQVLPWLFCTLVSSCAVLNGMFVCIHWAFRPENVFSERFRRFADDPLVYLLSRCP